MRAALAFLTPLPVGAGPPDASTLPWLAVAGALIGVVVGGSWWATAEVLPALVAAGVVVLVDVVVTGALHLDGLADSADGLLSHQETSDRRRAVMAAPDVGAFGVVALATVVLLRWSAFASVVPDLAVVAALWSVARGAMAVALVTVPYAGGGLGAAFLGGPRLPVLLVAGVLPLALALLADDPAVAVGAVLAAAVTAAAVVAFGRRRLGGVTGDVCGAAGVVAETVGLVVAVARW